MKFLVTRTYEVEKTVEIEVETEDQVYSAIEAVPPEAWNITSTTLVSTQAREKFKA